MWHFAIGLYLVELTPGSLRLTAIYQLVSTLSIIIFGPLVGDWVDANPRLKVARVSLIIQNVAVIICGILLLVMLMVEPPCPQPHLPSYFRVLEALVIIIGSIADLSSVGTKIAVEKDWVVVLAGSDKKLLARKNQSYFTFLYSF
ncbi:PREDICTED: solute carrier family 40 member 1-like [Acropora digitifera]|uniref:solute carrier family 40 member 1-like n=1 Tax=Acropora digitifera TaxID=70779 RepID=UPI00077A12CA|nr:PREDICTED: solute carrier family 40 member 1-like [Acropora digitifera]